MAIQLTNNTEGCFLRIKYWDGYVLDRNTPLNIAHAEASRESANREADVDICVGATVLATYRNGQQR